MKTLFETCFIIAMAILEKLIQLIDKKYRIEIEGME